MATESTVTNSKGMAGAGNVSASVEEVKELFLELNKTLHTLKFYPYKHPMVQNAVRRAMDELQGLLAGSEQINFVIGDDGIYFQGNLIAGNNAQVAGLAADFRKRRIQKLNLLSNLSIQEFGTFLQVVSTDPKNLRQQGGVEKILYECDVRNVLVNEVDYERILKDKEQFMEQQRTENDPMRMLSEESSESDVSLEKDDEVNKTDIDIGIELDSEERNINEADLERLLRDLIHEEDLKSYKLILAKLALRCKQLLQRGELDRVFLALRVLAKESEREWDRAEEFREKSRATIVELGNEKILLFTIDRLCRGDDGDSKVSGDILFFTGPGVIDLLLNRLSSEKKLGARRKIINLVARFDKSAIPVLKNHLDDEKWYVVRNVLTILREIKSPSTEECLVGAIGHPDHRVRKEVIKLLTMSSSEWGIRLLISLLEDRDWEVRVSAISALGALKARAAVPQLAGLAGKGILIRRKFELRKEALSTLGKIGGDEAISILEQTMFKRRFIYKKRYNQLRLCAAKALLAMGGKAVVDIFVKGSKSRDRFVRQLCEEVLAKKSPDTTNLVKATLQ